MEITYHPTTFLDAEVSLFKNVYSKSPKKTITFRDWIFKENEGLRDKVNRIRAEQNSELKLTLPCITGSGVIMGSRADNNLKHHNGCIIIDVDYKDNTHIKKKDFFQLKEKVFRNISEICYAGQSVRGKGYYLIMRIENHKRHKEYFEHLSKWFKNSEDINIDISGQNIGRLRIYSIDDNPYVNEEAAILRESLLGEVKKPSIKVKNQNTDIDDLVNKIEASGISIAQSYEEYLQLAIVFYNEQGEDGRSCFHRVCCLDSKYDSKDCDALFDDILKRNYTRCTVGTLVHLMKKYNVI
jgi:hypothetical protein